MQYAIFPMKTISISQRFHDSHKAWDMNGEDTGIDYWYAPCRVKVLAMFDYKTTGFYNTVLFGSCDEAGNPAEVLCEDGISRVLTFGCTHMDSLDKFSLAVGKIYESGERCYCEGNTGLGSTGNHVHMDVAEGWQYKRIKYSDGQWLLPNLTTIANVFYRLKDWNVDRNLNGYTFKEVESREAEEAASIDKYFVGCTSAQNTRITALENDEGNPTPITLKQFYDKFKDSYEEIIALSAGQYFVNKNQSNYGEIQGKIIGDNTDRAPEQDAWLDVAWDENEDLQEGNFSSGEWRKPYTKFAFSPAAKLISGGVYSNEFSPKIGDWIFDNEDYYVVVSLDWCNQWGLWVNKMKLTPNKIREIFMTDKNIRSLWLCDGGGSAEIYFGGNDELFNPAGENRKVPAVYAIVKDKEQVPEEPEPIEPSPDPVPDPLPEPEQEEPTPQPDLEPEPEEPSEDQFTLIGKLIYWLISAVKALFK